MRNIARTMTVATGVMLLAFAGAATAGGGVEISQRPDTPTLRVQPNHRVVSFQRATLMTPPITGVEIQFREGIGSGGTLLGIPPSVTAFNLTKHRTVADGGWVVWVCQIKEVFHEGGLAELIWRCP